MALFSRLRQRAFAFALLFGCALFGGFFPALGQGLGQGLGQDAPPARLRGTIESVDGRLLVIKPQDGASLKVRLVEKARINALVKASLADVKPGTFVGITSAPNDKGGQKALEIHVFPEAMRGTGEGQRPWDLAPQTTMTNGNIDVRVAAVEGEDLTLSFKAGAAKIEVPPDTTIVAFAEFRPDDLKPGNKAILFGLKKGEDGVLEAAAISIGRDGLTPPM